ncbi:hypothetical protein ACJJTC_000580 [Scirpophaga incertulas]
MLRIVNRAVGKCVNAPRKRLPIYLLFLLATTLAVLVISGVQVQLPREAKMEEHLADMQLHLHYLESLYHSRQEDVMNIQNEMATFRNNHKKLPDRMVPTDNSKSTTLSPEVVALLSNISKTRAAAGVSQKNIETLKLPFVYQLLPHLMIDHNSLRPAYHMKKGKTFADIVIGIPTVKRDKESYLIVTLTHLINGLKAKDINSTLIVVMVGETDLEYVIQTARQIEIQFPKYTEIGLIEVISPSSSYYPDFDSLPVTLGDSLKRVKWRTKQNLDTIFLMAYAQSKGAFYLMLEDDVIAKANYMQDIRQFTAATTVKNPNWFYIEYCQIGGIGKLFKSSNLIHFVTYVQLFYNNMPIDWLLESYLADRVCTIEKNSKTCAKSKEDIRPKFKSSLFQHIGLYSSLKGKIQKIKDSHFGAVPTFYPHKNPPLESLRTNIKEHMDHTIRKAYEGYTFFWGVKPKAGDYIEFWFEKPTRIERYTFRSGNVEHISDRFYNTNIEILPVSKANFTAIGCFDEFGLADSEINTNFGPLMAIRIKVNINSQFWVILSEIDLKLSEKIS